MELSKALQQLILDEISKDLQLKPFSTDPSGGKGYSASAMGRSDEPVELTVGDAKGNFRVQINVNALFHRVKATAPQAAKLNTLPATLGRVAALVSTLKAGEKK